MRLEKSCGAVIYRRFNNTIEYLAVRSRAFGHWGFAKGHVEKGESEHKTARREVKEETGLNIELRDGFKTSVEYSPVEGTQKEVVFFIGESLDKNVDIQQEEIQDYKWLNYSNMLELLTFDTDKRVLSKAKNFIDDIYF